MFNDQIKSRRVGLGRPLCTVPKTDSEVARVVILQEQPEDAQRPGRRIVRYVSSLRHPAGPTARSHGDRSRKQGEGSSFAIYLKHREICDKLLFKK